MNDMLHSTEAATETTTKATTEAATEAVTETGTETGTETATETTTKATTKATTEAATEAITETGTETGIVAGIVAMLKTVYDPEIPVNLYDLGLIYKVEVSPEGEALIEMTLTAPGCPAADYLMEDVRMKVGSVAGVRGVDVRLVFDPEWNKDMMSDEAKLELGFL
jgi:FeS assembly SUF system protein